MNKHAVAGLVALLVASTGLQSCGLYRRIFPKKKNKAATVAGTGTQPGTPPAVTPGQPDNTGADTINTAISVAQLLPLWNASTSFKTFSGKARLHYEGKGDNQDVTAIIRIERDKRVWVSVIALGLVEAARALITPDSVLMIDRIHHTYKALPVSDAGKVLPAGVTFATLQQLLIGDVLQRGLQPTIVNNLPGGLLQLSVTKGGDYQNAVFAPAGRTLQSQLLNSGGGATFASVRYEDYKDADGRRFAMHRIIKLQEKGQEYNIDLEFSRAEFDKPLEFGFSIPERYERK